MPRTSCEGFLSYSRAKSKFVAEQSLLHFVASHKDTYFWTNTFADEGGNDHAIAVARCKPLFDWLRRKHIDYLFFWEQTRQGRWHLHWVCDRYIGVSWFRDWMVERGWGPQMRVERALYKECVRWDGRQWVYEDSSVRRLVAYLCKYLTKSFGVGAQNVKVWGGPARCRMGTIGFKWLPYINPKAFLFHFGRELFVALHGHLPKWRDVKYVMRLGYEVTGWSEVDPWFLDTS